MRRASLVSLILATVCTGLMTGFIFTYSLAVMPGLANTRDASFVDAFQQIDHSLDSKTWFWVAIFLGSMCLIILSIALNLKLHIKPTLTWLIVAAILYAATIAITGFGIDSLENDFGKAGDPSEVLDASRVRANFNEDGWVLLNKIRLATNTLTFACLAWSLVLFGRSTSQTSEENPGLTSEPRAQG